MQTRTAQLEFGQEIAVNQYVTLGTLHSQNKYNLQRFAGEMGIEEIINVPLHLDLEKRRPVDLCMLPFQGFQPLVGARECKEEPGNSGASIENENA